MRILLYAAAIFVAATLLFIVQPMFTRFILPLLGGAPNVWNTALVFFQAALLAGYAYAHYSTKWLGTRRQSKLHAVLLLLPLLFLPIGIGASAEPPADGNPVLWQLWTMAAAVGIPFFIVSASSPLLQRWFSELGDRRSGDPYFLYAASNIGSMAGLALYPVLIEPQLALRTQSVFWAVGYGLLVALMLGCAVTLWRTPEAAPEPVASGGAASEETTVARLASPGVWRRVRWVLLAFVPSALLMGITTLVSTTIASVPLLWVIPLTIYLVTFIITFARVRPIPHMVWVILTPPLILIALVMMITEMRDPIWMVAGGGFLALFVCSMMCHGELAEDRPDPTYLTEFFLLISVGGVLGGAFCALLAPIVFDQILEYPLALILCAALLPVLASARQKSTYLLDGVWPAIVAAVAVAAAMLVPRYDFGPSEFRAQIALGIPCLVALMAMLRPLRFAGCVAVILVVGLATQPQRQDVVWKDRGFFGTLWVEQTPWRTLFRHNTTMHGIQNRAPLLAKYATSYYHPTGPVGDVFDKRAVPPGATIGLVGLGAGSIVAYGKPDQRWTVYEIDPQVEQIARDPRFFTYLRDARAPVRVVLGDARLRLQDSPDQYDILLLDAYSSASVPIHLLTREAMEIYLRHLKPGGVILLHISNRFLDLESVVTALADATGVRARIRNDSLVTDQERIEGKASSSWMAIARTDADFGALNETNGWRQGERYPGVSVWTDDFSSIFEVLEWLRPKS